MEKGLCFPILFYRILFLIKICTLAVPHWYCISQPLLVAKPSALCEFPYFSFSLEYLAAEALRDSPSWLSQDLTLQSSDPAAGCSFDAAVQACRIAYLICSTLWPLFLRPWCSDIATESCLSSPSRFHFNLFQVS